MVTPRTSPSSTSTRDTEVPVSTSPPCSTMASRRSSNMASQPPSGQKEYAAVFISS